MAAAAGGGGAAAAEGRRTDLETPGILSGERNPRGIPAMRFLEDIAGFLVEHRTEAEPMLVSLQTMHSKYKMMESSLEANRRRLKAQIPDLSSSLDAVNLLIAKKEASEEFTTHFNLSDQVFAEASVPPTDRVCLWLGAKVMLEYSLDEAKALLEENLTSAKRKLEENSEDTDFLRDQVITTEVNMARVYNYDVVRRRAAGAAGAVSAAAGAPKEPAAVASS